MVKPASSSDPTPANLAAAAYDLWQEQWQLLRTDPAIVQDLQLIVEQFGRNMAAALAASPAGKDVPDLAAYYAQAMKGAAPHAANFATTATNPARPEPAAAASRPGGPDLAELAAAVATLAAKLDQLEARLEQQSAKTRRGPGRRRSKTTD